MHPISASRKSSYNGTPVEIALQTKFGIGGSHTSQEAVELHQNLQVDVVALGSLAVAAPHMVAVQVDTCDL